MIMTRPGRPRIIPDAQILETARIVYRERLHEASTHQIAAAVQVHNQPNGIPQSTLFQRFEDAENLFFMAMSPRIIQNIEDLLSPISREINQESLRQAVQGILAGPFSQISLLDNLLFLTKAGFRDQDALSQIEFLQLVEQVTQLWNPLENQLRMGAEASARLFIGSIFNAALLQYVTREEPNLDDLTDQLVRALLA